VSWFSDPVPSPPRSSDRHSHAFHAKSSPRCIHSSGDIIPIESEVDALFDALRGVAREEEDAARAQLDEQRQLSARQVLHFVYIDLIELAVGLKRASLLCRHPSEGAVDCKNKVAIVPETFVVVLSPAFVA
jgi:hypothetical protein